MADKPKKKRAKKPKQGELTEAKQPQQSEDRSQKADRKRKPAKDQKPKKRRDGSAKKEGQPKVAKGRRVRTKLARGDAAARELEPTPEETATNEVEVEATVPEAPGGAAAAAAEPEATELLVSLRYVEAPDGKKLWVYGAVHVNGSELGQVSRLRIEASEGKQLPKVELLVGKGLKSKDLDAAPDTKVAIEQTVSLLTKIPGIKVTAPRLRAK